MSSTTQHITVDTIIKMNNDANSKLAVRDYIDALADDEKAELLAVMWIGRHGSCTAEEFVNRVRHALTTLDHVGKYMMRKAPLSKYLTDGMQLLGM